MTTFSDLKFCPHPHHHGIRAAHKLANGITVSVVRTPHSYGGDEGLYELYIIEADGVQCEDLPGWDDPVGDLTEGGVTRVLQQIEASA